MGKPVCIWRPFAVSLEHMWFSFIQNKSYLSTLRPLHYMNQSIVNQAIKRYFRSSLYMNINACPSLDPIILDKHLASTISQPAERDIELSVLRDTIQHPTVSGLQDSDCHQICCGSASLLWNFGYSRAFAMALTAMFRQPSLKQPLEPQVSREGWIAFQAAVTVRRGLHWLQ